jgi:hypothetical protein
MPAALSRRKSASAGTFHGSCGTQASDKRNALYNFCYFLIFKQLNTDIQTMAHSRNV